MANPLATLRKYQVAFFVFFAVVCMLVFVIGDPLNTWLASRGGGSRTENTVVVSWSGGQLREQELGYEQSVRNVIREFIRRLLEETQRKNGSPRVQLVSLSPSEEDILFTHLLAQRAEKMGMVVSDEMALTYLDQLTANLIPRSGIGSIFHESVGGRITEQQLLGEIKLELLAQNYLSLTYPDLTQGRLPAQAWEYHRRLNRQVTAEVIPVKVADFKDKVTKQPTDSEMEAMYAMAKDRYPDPASPEPGFRRHRKVAFGFVRADRKKFEEEETAKAKPEVTDQEIQEYYDKNKLEFRIPETPAEPEKPATAPPSAANPPAESPPQGPPEKSSPEKAAPEKTAPEKATDDKGGPSESSSKKDEPAAGATPEKSAPPATETPDKSGEAESSKKSDNESKEGSIDPCGATEQDESAGQQGDTKGQEPPAANEKGADAQSKDTPAATEKSAAEKGTVEKTAPENPAPEKTALEKTAPEKTSPEKKDGVPAGQDPAKATAESKDAPPTDPAQPATPPAPATPGSSAVPAAPPIPQYKPLDDSLKGEIRERIAKQKAARAAQQRIDAGYEEIRRAVERYGRELRTAEVAGRPAPQPLELATLAEKHGMTAGSIPLSDPTQVQQQELGKTRGFDFTSMSFEPIPFHTLAYRDGIPLWKPDQIRGGVAEGNPDIEYLYWKTKEEPPFVPELKDIRDEVVDTWKLQQAVGLAEAEAKTLAEKARKEGKPLKEVFAADPAIKVVETNPFSWMTRGFLPVNMGGSPTLSSVENVESPGQAFMQAVFALQPGGITAAINQPQSVVYVVRIASESPDEDTLREQFLQTGGSPDLQQLALFDRLEIRRDWLQSLQREFNVKWERSPQS